MVGFGRDSGRATVATLWCQWVNLSQVVAAVSSASAIINKERPSPRRYNPLRDADPHNLGSPLGFYLEVDGFGDVPCRKESTDANLQARLNARNCAFH